MFDHILITGAGGQLGQCVWPLVRRMWPRACVTLVGGRGLTHAEGVQVVQADLRSEADWNALEQEIDVIFHLAAVIPTVSDSPELFDYNASMARNLTLFARKSSVRHIIYSSSIAVYPFDGRPLRESTLPHPASFYGAGKLAGEILLETLDPARTAVASLRLSSLYGRGRGPGKDRTVLYRFLQLARQGECLIIHGCGQRTQDFIHVDDAARLFVRMAELSMAGIFNAGSGQATTMRELAQEICRVTERSEDSIRFDMERDEGAGVVLDMAKTMAATGWEPTVSLRQGLQDVLRG